MNQSKKIAWIVHPRDIQDVRKSNKIFNILPDFALNIIVRKLPPYIISPINTNIGVGGIVIAVPMFPKDFRVNKDIARKKIIKAIKIAKKKGINNISVGGFISSTINKIKDNHEFDNIRFYDGIDLLSTIASKQIGELIKKNQLKKIGILGATTKVGRKLLENISKIYEDDIIIFGTNKERLDELLKELSQNSISNIKISTDLNLLKECDLVALTTYINDNSIVDKIKNKSIFFSVIEPISPFVKKIECLKDKNIFVIKGVSIHTPGVSYGRLNSGLEKEYSHACVTEAYIMVNTKDEEICNPKNVGDKIFDILKRFNFKPKKIKNV